MPAIDDSDIDTITITAGDFEGGFFVNGTELTSGLFDSGSLTLDDGLIHDFGGSWIDLGGSDAQHPLYFGLGSEVHSGVEALGESDGALGTITGAFVGFDPSVSFGTFDPVRPQDGSAVDFSFPFLRATFISEAVSVPEPATLGLLCVGLTGLLGFARRRSRRPLTNCGVCGDTFSTLKPARLVDSTPLPNLEPVDVGAKARRLPPPSRRAKVTWSSAYRRRPPCVDPARSRRSCRQGTANDPTLVPLADMKVATRTHSAPLTIDPPCGMPRPVGVARVKRGGGTRASRRD